MSSFESIFVISRNQIKTIHNMIDDDPSNSSELTRFPPVQDGLLDELSSYADEVFETPSEAAIRPSDESELTGSALDKKELERSHLMLWAFSQDLFE